MPIKGGGLLLLKHSFLEKTDIKNNFSARTYWRYKDSFSIFAVVWSEKYKLMSSVKQLLQLHQLRLTSNRAEILDMFVSNKTALSQPDIEKALKESCDRVTIYRTLNTFLEKGLIHKVPDDTGLMKYAICHSDCDAETYHHHEHPHFKCEKCGNTECLEDIKVSLPALPGSYKLKETNILMQGICPACK